MAENRGMLQIGDWLIEGYQIFILNIALKQNIVPDPWHFEKDPNTDP